MLVLLAAMGRTNFAIQGSKRLIIDRCTLIVAFALSNFAVPSEKDVPLLWKCLETNGNNECSATINLVYSMIIAAISYSNANSG
jgi:hypothetical protein